MGSPLLLYFDQSEVDQRLAALGLDMEVLTTAALQGLAGWASCTLNHPPTYPGTVAWAEGTRALREGLFARGWMRKNETNLPLVVNAAETIAIAFTSGDADTGRKDGYPSTRSAKGPKTAQAVRVNQRQEQFAFMDPGAVIASIKTAGRSTWLLLTYRDTASRELRSELSRPIDMTEDGHVSKWAERIILTAFPLDENPQFESDDANQSPEITVEIKQLG